VTKSTYIPGEDESFLLHHAISVLPHFSLYGFWKRMEFYIKKTAAI